VSVSQKVARTEGFWMRDGEVRVQREAARSKQPMMSAVSSGFLAAALSVHFSARWSCVVMTFEMQVLRLLGNGQGRGCVEALSTLDRGW
jgi:hypothetical protein